MIGYDTETYPNVFTLSAMDSETGELGSFEVSPRQNHMPQLIRWLMWVSQTGRPMIGFNNEHFDYPIIHMIMTANGEVTPEQIYTKAMAIIRGNDRWAHTVWDSDKYIPQIDLFKIHHFDNMAKATSLKALQIAMKSESVEDLPFPVGTVLENDQIDTLLSYNRHDVTETMKFAEASKDEIEFRQKLTNQLGRNFMNFNDTKIGKEYFIMELEKLQPGICYTRVNGKREPRQTHRSAIRLADIIFPYIQFVRPEFQRTLEWFKQQAITQTKGLFEDVYSELDGMKFHFGQGGIHASVESQTFRECEANTIIDIDVTSFYTNLAINNRVYPEHLGETFCDIYTDVFNQRKQYKKGTVENAMLKLALNGVFGDSNNVYGPFYDPQYTMSITINGQLVLCMLAEQLLTIPGLKLIQANTDGLTVLVPRAMEFMVDRVRSWWEGVTGLQLEDARYTLMAVRDVNNYLAVTTEGKTKLKGAFDYRPLGQRPDVPGKGWHQNPSNMIAPRAAVEAITHGVDVAEFIRGWTDPFDFMLRAKAPRGSHLILRQDGREVELQSTTRYYVSKSGGSLVKISPPPAGCVLGQYKRANGVSVVDYNRWHHVNGNQWNPDIHTKNKSVYEQRELGFVKGWLAKECNRAEHFDFADVDYDFYIKEAMKLVEGVRSGQ